MTLPRYVPDKPLPDAAYVPGRTARPIAHPPETAPSGGDDARPRDFLRGIDLFNHGYYWEAHEAWERCWHATGRQGARSDALKGLIALAAAGVKARQGNAAGVAHHARRGAILLARACGTGGTPPFGLPLVNLIAHAESLAQSPPVDETPTDGGRQVLPFVIVL